MQTSENVNELGIFEEWKEAIADNGVSKNDLS